MKLTINLATRRYLNVRRLSATLLISALVLGACLAASLREFAYNRAELDRIRALGALLDRRTGGAPAVDPARAKALAARIRFANGLIAKKSVNWLKLLDSLEEAVPGGVALTQIEPVPGEAALKIGGVGRSFANLQQLLENMEQSRHFSEVYLLSQSDTKVGLTQQGVVFTLTCKVGDR